MKKSNLLVFGKSFLLKTKWAYSYPSQRLKWANKYNSKFCKKHIYLHLFNRAYLHGYNMYAPIPLFLAHNCGFIMLDLIRIE
jgi:hypothetical protein